MVQWTQGCMYLFELIFSFSLDKYTEVELLDHMVALFLIFEDPRHHLPNWLYQFTFPPTVHEGSLFSTSLPTPVICCLFGKSFWQVWCDISLWFWLLFPWWLVLLNIFSCAYWQSAYFFGKVPTHVHCTVFNWVAWFFVSEFWFWFLGVFFCLFFGYWVVWVLYIFCVITVYQICGLQILSSIV